jgi:hypothetical protein
LEFAIPLTDTESPLPALNPYFHLNNNECTGIWSDTIVDALARTRPKAYFLDKSETLGDIGFKDGQVLGSPVFSKTRPQSVKVSSYLSLSGGITIN